MKNGIKKIISRNPRNKNIYVYSVTLSKKEAEYIGLALIQAKGNKGERVEIDYGGEVVRLNIEEERSEKDMKPSVDLTNEVLRI